MKKIINAFVIIISLAVLAVVWDKYQTTNMNIFTRAEFIQNGSEFTRDSEVKYSDYDSYKIKSDIYNDAMLFVSVDVEPHTAYRVTCMVKTKNVIPETENSGSGAIICITDTTEQSSAITGTEDWQMIELKFNSKERESVDIGFRLGGNAGDCIGEVWFSDFKIEEGFLDTDNKWNFACFVLKNLDVEVEHNGKTERVQISMNDSEISEIKSDIERFEKSCSTLSNNKMSAECEIIYIDEPITSLTYEEGTGYFLSPFDAEKLIDEYVQAGNYDHIFTVIKLDSEKYDDTIEIDNWVGLGYMDYQGIGFSDIRIPSDSSKFMYIYDSKINVFPEEVFVHEFLHSLERTSNEYEFDTIELHSNAEYGYKNEFLTGLKYWYSDYMSKNIYDSKNNNYIGLDERVYTLKPVNNEDFKYAIEIKNVFVEPQNIIEEFELIIKKVSANLSGLPN